MIQNIFLNIGTNDFYGNLAAELIGLIIEILLLSIFIPLVITLYKFYKYRRIRFLIIIELLNLYNKLTSSIVEFVLGDKRYDILTDLTCSEPGSLKYICDHRYYGQLDNNLLLIKNKISPSDISSAIKCADINKLKEMASVCKEFLHELDRLIALLSFLPRKQSDLYALRPMFIRTGDIFHKFVIKKERDLVIGVFISLEESSKVIHSIGENIEFISRKDRKRINRRIKSEGYKQLWGIFVKLIKP